MEREGGCVHRDSEMQRPGVRWRKWRRSTARWRRRLSAGGRRLGAAGCRSMRRYERLDWHAR
ncbi:hypothetical protein M8494_37925 [Serratia ureilytica]